MSVRERGVKPASGVNPRRSRVNGRRRLADGEPDAAARVVLAVSATKRAAEGGYG